MDRLRKISGLTCPRSLRRCKTPAFLQQRRKKLPSGRRRMPRLQPPSSLPRQHSTHRRRLTPRWPRRLQNRQLAFQSRLFRRRWRRQRRPPRPPSQGRRLRANPRRHARGPRQQPEHRQLHRPQRKRLALQRCRRHRSRRAHDLGRQRRWWRASLTACTMQVLKNRSQLGHLALEAQDLNSPQVRAGRRLFRGGGDERDSQRDCRDVCEGVMF